ncbi:MAG TPA: winged helix-turn-helix domain-containing protein, partial [Stellaceae bacterium]|nr:winged helix-turn-helix domain-containing protein [Stellaceae bacterium]
MYSLIWQSVMWRPGKLRFLIGGKNPLPIRPAVTTRKHGPLQGRAVARFATSVGLRPPFVTHPATLSHPDCRAVFILFVAQQRILKEEFEIDCSLSSTYRLLHRLKLSWLAPRPRHPQA